MEEAVSTAALLQESTPYFNLDAVNHPAPGGAALISVNSGQAQNPPFLNQSIATRSHEFIIDTGATKNIVFNKDLLTDIREIEPFILFTATGQHTQVKYQGTVRLNDRMVINNVCFIPRATHNLISLSVLLDGGAEVSHVSADRITIEKSSGSVRGFINFRREIGFGVWKLKLDPSFVQVWINNPKVVLPLKLDQNKPTKVYSQNRTPIERFPRKLLFRREFLMPHLLRQ